MMVRRQIKVLNMKKLNITINKNEYDEKFPFYDLDGYDCPDVLYVVVDLETGDCSLLNRSAGEKGVSFEKYNGSEEWFKIDPKVTVENLLEAIESNRTLLEELMNETRIEYKGSNKVGITSERGIEIIEYFEMNGFGELSEDYIITDDEDLLLYAEELEGEFGDKGFLDASEDAVQLKLKLLAESVVATHGENMTEWVLENIDSIMWSIRERYVEEACD
ncbi:hypothetical protein BCU23_25120 [Vibrio splendidus]|nr:hypothetical protein BCU23_25120 [Vibrio splendidus]